MIDPKAMDIYEVQIQKGIEDSFCNINTNSQTAPTRQQNELQLLVQGRHLGSASCRGVATWLVEGISTEEAQVTLQIDVRKLGRHPTEHQQLEITCYYERLQGEIDCWEAMGLIFLGNGIGDGDVQPLEQELLGLKEDQDQDITNEFGLFEPEKIFISMPSNLGVQKCTDIGATDLIQQELTLRKGQVNDALHNI